MIRRLEPHVLGLLVALCLLAALDRVQGNGADDLSQMKFSQHIGPTVNILYCYSCGYRKVFDEYSQIIQTKYPYMNVNGSNYNPPGLYMLLSRLITLAKILVVCAILAGMNIFQYINQPPPPWWTWCTENKLYACMMVFFCCNILENHLVQSGAFEISVDNVPVWSKLETGRIPQPAELFQIIDSHMQFSTDSSVEYNSGFPK